MFVFRPVYLIVALALFCVEVLIALYINDDLIRPHVGDLLVVILIYAAIRSFFDISVNKAAIVTLIFAYIIEVLQYLKIVQLLGLQDSQLARVIIGTHFSWIDMFAYTAGVLIVLFVEKTVRQPFHNGQR